MKTSTDAGAGRPPPPTGAGCTGPYLECYRNQVDCTSSLFWWYPYVCGMYTGSLNSYTTYGVHIMAWLGAVNT